MIEITTNHNRREFLGRHEVPEEVLAGELDWTDDTDSGSYICYRGFWYHIAQFMRAPHIEGWDGIHTDSFFSGVVIALTDDGDTYKIGSLISKSDY